MAHLNQQILTWADGVQDYMTEIRRIIHRNPEPGMKEVKTSALICSELDKLGIPYRKNVGGTGVVAVVSGTAPGEGRVIGIRADMDALPVTETSGAEYASEIPGFMHACGHDAHVAMLLGAGRILQEHRDQFSGKAVLLFQPAEEGPGGALPMINDGALENPHVDSVIGIHVASSARTGIVRISPGPMHAAQTEVHISITGKGGHAAYPHKTVDAIVLAAQAINAFQTVVSRKVDPVTPAVFTIGTIRGGYRHNIIADRVDMEGTFRFFDEELGKNLQKWAKEILEGITKPAGGDFSIECIEGYPPTVNHKELSKVFLGYLKDLLGPEKVKEDEKPAMGAEDFAYFCKARPSVFIMLGTGGPDEKSRYAFPHHHPCFDVDETAFATGAASFVKIALEFMGSKAE